MQLIDTHCHVGEADYDEDRDDVLRRAREVGVSPLVVVAAGGDVETNRRVLDLCDREPDCFGVVGIHPHHASNADEALLDEIRSCAAHAKVVGIGETGLDFHYDHSPRDVQRDAFRRFVALARETELPLVVHSRNAADDTLALLEELAFDRAVLHCFTYDAPVAERAVRLGLHVSFSGVVTFRNAEALRHAARVVPLDRIMVETDSPFLAPEPKRGGRNEPARVVDVARGLAAALGVPEGEVASRTTENARRFFGLQ